MVSHTALAAASTRPPGPSSADLAMSLRPSRPPGQAITRYWSPATGSTARLAVIWPSRIAVSRARPVAASHPGGAYTMAMYFTSEQAAREGERKEPPPKLKAQMEEMDKLSIGQPEFFDLRQAWLYSPR